MRATRLALGLIVSGVTWGSFGLARAQEIDGEGLLPIQASNKHGLEGQLGIQILAVRLKSANSLLALRFRVVDADRASLLFDRDQPHIVHHASGAKLHSVAPPFPHPQPEGRYTILFPTAGAVKPGDAVTMLVGDFRVQGIIVFASVDPAAF